MLALVSQEVALGSPADHGALLGLGDDDHAQYTHISAARTITAQHTFNPATPMAPFGIGANGANQTVTNLRAGSLPWSIIAGNGITGGGALTADRTLNLGTPGTLSATSTNTATGNHTHSITGTDDPGASKSILTSSTSGHLTLTGLSIGDGTPLDDAIILPTGGGWIGPSATNYISFTPAGSNVRLRQNLIITDGTDDAGLNIDTGGLLEIYADGDIELMPATSDVFPGDDTINLGGVQRKYLTLHARELWVTRLIAETVMATIGGRVIVAPSTSFAVDLGDTGLDNTIYTEHNNLAVDDIIYCEFDGRFEAMLILTGPTGAGPYTYGVTRNLDGSGLTPWYTGEGIFNTGQPDDGYIDLYANSAISDSTIGPAIMIGIRTGTNWNDIVEAGAFGNLNGLYGYSADTYGVAFGRYGSGYSHMTIDPTAGIRMRNGTGTVVGQWEPDGDFTLGQVATDKANFFWDQSEGRLSVRGGTAGTVEAVYFDNQGVLSAGLGDVILNTDGISIISSTTYDDINSYKFTDSAGTVAGGLYHYQASPSNYMKLHNQKVGTRTSDLKILNESYENGQLTLTVANYYPTYASRTLLLSGNGLDVQASMQVDGTTHLQGQTHMGIQTLSTPSTNQTYGLTIDQYTADDEVLALGSSSDVAHGMTNEVDTQMFGVFSKIAVNDGGLDISAYTEQTSAYRVRGCSTNDNTTKGDTALAPIELIARKRNLGSTTSPGTNANLLVVGHTTGAYNGTVFIIDKEGDYHYHGSGSAFDEYDDAHLLRAMALSLPGPGIVQSKFDAILTHSKEDLANLGIVTYNENSAPFINGPALQKLLMGAVWQLYEEIQKLKTATKTRG